MSISLNESKFHHIYTYVINTSIFQTLKQHPRFSELIFVFSLWSGLAFVFDGSAMPYPHEVFFGTWEVLAGGNVWTHVSYTFTSTFIAFFITMVIGIVMGVSMASNKYGMNLFLPYVVIGLSVPAIAWAAIATLALGIGILVPIISAILIMYPIVALIIWKGVEDIDVNRIEMSDSFNISRRRKIRRVILPDIAPALFASSRYGLAIGWKIVTIAEIFAGSRGIGYMIINTFDQFQWAQTWGWAAIFVGIVLFIEYAILQPLEKRAYKYKEAEVYTAMG